MKTPLSLSLSCLLLWLIPLAARGQVNSGSTGADGAFNPMTNTVVDMSNHPDDRCPSSREDHGMQNRLPKPDLTRGCEP